MTMTTVKPLDVVQLVTPTCDGRLLAWCDSYDVAVLPAHDGEPGIDDERLRRAAHAVNELVIVRGCGLPLLIGHVGDTAEFPPITGYIDNANVRPGRDGTPTLYVRERMFPTVTIDGRVWTAAQLRRQFPRRSIEYQEPFGVRAVGMLGSGSPPLFPLPMVRELQPAAGAAATPMAFPVEFDSL
jgi:hypothetical protein